MTRLLLQNYHITNTTLPDGPSLVKFRTLRLVYVPFTSCQMRRPPKLILRGVRGEMSRMRWQKSSRSHSICISHVTSREMKPTISPHTLRRISLLPFLYCRATMPTPTRAIEKYQYELILFVFQVDFIWVSYKESELLKLIFTYQTLTLSSRQLQQNLCVV